jgi:hypothetical protein
MDTLAGYSSDDSDDDAPHHPSSLSGSIANDGDDDDATKESSLQLLKRELQPLPKRTKMDVPVVDVDAKITALFPPPPLGNNSLITSEVDYFTPKYGIPLAPKGEMPLKLLQLSSSSTIWSEKLKSQHEFHNPAFFQTAVHQFGIQDALGTTMTCLETMHDYESDLIRLEEEARIRQQLQQQQDYVHPPIAAPTPYAQEQLERAMQIHLRR